MKIKLELSEEQFNQLLHYDETKSITTACNLVTSLIEQLKGKNYFVIKDKVNKDDRR